VGRRHITTTQLGALIFAAATLLSTRPAQVAFESRPTRALTHRCRHGAVECARQTAYHSRSCDLSGGDGGI